MMIEREPDFEIYAQDREFKLNRAANYYTWLKQSSEHFREPFKASIEMENKLISVTVDRQFIYGVLRIVKSLYSDLVQIGREEQAKKITNEAFKKDWYGGENQIYR